MQDEVKTLAHLAQWHREKAAAWRDEARVVSGDRRMLAVDHADLEQRRADAIESAMRAMVERDELRGKLTRAEHDAAVLRERANAHGEDPDDQEPAVGDEVLR